VQPPDRVGVRDLELIGEPSLLQMLVEHQRDFQRRDRAFVRDIDVDDDLAALKRVDRVAQLASRLKLVELVRALREPRDHLRRDVGPRRDDEEIVLIRFARLAPHDVFFDIDAFGRVEDEIDPAVEDRPLVAAQFGPEAAPATVFARFTPA
jgi:hypothetical protein